MLLTLKSNTENISELNTNKRIYSSKIINKWNNYLITGTFETSEINKMNSFYNKLTEKNNSNFENIIGFDTIEKYENQNNFIEILNNKYKAFEALENLENEDNINNITKKKHKHKHKEKNKKRKKLMERSRNAYTSKSLNKKLISVPKLDFTKIFKEYNKKKYQIKGKSINSKKNIKKLNCDDDENEKIVYKIILEQDNHHHHHKHHHGHYNYEKRKN